MATKAAWQKEREAKLKQKQWEEKQNDHRDWQQKREDMLKKKEAAEQKARDAEQNAPEFLKKLGNMKERAANKPQKKEDEGPTIEELDDGTDIPPWHRHNAREKPEWVVLLLLAAEREAQEEDEDHVYVASVDGNRSLELDNLPSELHVVSSSEPEWKKHARNLRSSSDLLDDKSSNSRRRNSFNSSDPQAQPRHTTSLTSSPKPTAREAMDETSSRRPPPKYASKSASADFVTGDDKPEWMKGAEKLRRKKKPIPTEAVSPTPAAAAAEQPEWMAHRSKIQQQKLKEGASSEPAPKKENKQSNQSNGATSPEEGQPAWMIQRSKIQQKRKEESASDDAHTKKASVEPQSTAINDQPEWMKQRSKIKQKMQTEGGDATSQPSTAPQTSASDLTLPKEQPAWMVQRSKIKQKAQGDLVTTDKQSEAKPSATEVGDDDHSGDHSKPPLALNEIVPRISVNELRSSVVQEKLEKREPMRKSSIILTKEELTTNKVKEKLAQKPSLVDKKAPVRTEEMEWMKKKLKPRAIDTHSKPSPKNNNVDDDRKPAWMKHTLKPRVSPEELQTSTVQEKLQSKQPIRESSLRNISREELLTNIVKEKLHSREPMRESSLRNISKKELTTNAVQEKLQNRAPILESSLSNISKEELNHNIVKEKMAQRPSYPLDKRTSINAQEMVEQEEKLKSFGASHDSMLKPAVTMMDHRTELMPKAHVRIPSNESLDTSSRESESNSPPSWRLSGAQHENAPDSKDGPMWVQEAHRRMSAQRILDAVDGEDNTAGVTSSGKDGMPKEDDKRHASLAEACMRGSSETILDRTATKDQTSHLGCCEHGHDKPNPDKRTERIQLVNPGGGEKSDDKPAFDTVLMTMQKIPTLESANGENVANQSQGDTVSEKMERRRKSSRKSISLSDTEEDEVKKVNCRQPLQRSKTMDERVETKSEWWRESAHQRLVEKGLLSSDDPFLKSKAANAANPASSTTGATRAAVSEGARYMQGVSRSDAVAKEWTGISPVDIMTPKNSSAVDDRFWESFSMTDDTDTSSADQGDQLRAKRPPGDDRFWSSLVSLGKQGSERSFASGSSNEKPATKEQFNASMNDLAAVMRSSEDAGRSTGRRKSLSSKERSKSRSRSGSTRPRKSKDKDKEKDAEKKSSKKEKKEKTSSTAKESVDSTLVRRKSFSSRGAKKDKKDDKKEKKKRKDK